MQEENIHSLIVRLFSGEATSEEKGIVGEWMSLSEENREMYSDLQEIWLTTGSSNDYNTEKAVAEFKKKIKTKEVRVISMTNMLKYAAVVLLLISLPIMYYWGKESVMPDESFTTITCAMGDKSTITLPDGSVVNLNSGSKLTFKNDFHDTYRMVALEGEAYFSVAKNPDIPFKITTSDIEIEVLGTEFNLKAYPYEPYISTTLVEGSVQINSGSQKTVMKPSQKAVFSRADQKMNLYELEDMTLETLWKEGRLVFRNESLGDLELKLERWFDVDIEFADDEVKKRRFTGVLNRESILETVTYFGYSEYVGYRIEDNKITFYSKKRETNK
ncbi:DUF4974 domain-containing protein [Puteibacter caeruleilacunae]|nr:DUF4974 domain-containing protein [Puteibacter caeruleilacunae]